MAGVNTFEVLSPGIMSSVQDLGRFGGARYGVAVSGGLDGFALRIANLLVGNAENAAVIETTLMGLRIQLLRDTALAVTGGDLQARREREPLPLWRSFMAREGQTISFGGPVSGFRAYIAVAGGISVPIVMGSRSTYLSSAMGGFKGRSLRKGDILAAEPVNNGRFCVEKSLDPELIPRYASPWRLRIVWGPQDDHFSKAAQQTFTASSYTVSADSDRTGIRLKGPLIACMPHVGDSIISEGIVSGAIQVPGDGQPIIILGETASGGYRKIGTIITADVPLLGQITPGDEVAFEAVSMEEAVQALRVMEATIARFKRTLG
jgi:antagonist of KipI